MNTTDTTTTIALTTTNQIHIPIINTPHPPTLITSTTIQMHMPIINTPKPPTPILSTPPPTMTMT